jgi:PhnB protein
MQLHPSLMFSGQCEEAFRFYERVLGGELTMLQYAGSPMAGQVGPEWQTKIMHARLIVGDGQLTGGDVTGPSYERPRGFSILLGIDDPGEAERVFHALSESGQVTMPIQETFWSLRYGALIDRFGIPWEVNCAQAPASVTASSSELTAR